MRLHWLIIGVASVTLASLADGCGGSYLEPGETADAGENDAAPVSTLADRVAIDSVDINQAVDVPLVTSAQAVTSSTPIIAARPGLVRVGIRMKNQRTSAVQLDAELHLSVSGRETAVLKDSKKLLKSSAAASLGSTFDFDVTADELTPDTSWSVIVRDPTTSSDPTAVSAISFPSDGSMLGFGAQTSTADLKIKIVPVQYDFVSTDGDAGLDAGGSAAGLLPDTSDAQVQRYHDTLYKMYPTATVDITVRDPMPWNEEILPDGTGWDDLILAIMGLRAQDNAPDDVFYVGAFQSTLSLDSFCSSGCVLGEAQLAAPGDIAARMALVAGYSGQEAPDTLNQELGHALGREHADCGGADSPDRKFPYPSAGIGVWGYDLLEKQLIDPNGDVFDFMGYCQPIWISDYTYSALFNRLTVVEAQPRVIRPPIPYQAIHIGRDGSLRWGRQVMLTSEPVGELTEVALLSGSGSELRRVAGHVYRHEKTGGAFALIPAVDEAVRRVRMRMSGGVAKEIERR